MTEGSWPSEDRLLGRHEERSRSRWLWLWTVGCVVAIAVAFAAGTQVRSPWESAAENSHVRPVVTARAEVRALATEVLPVAGTVSLGVEQAVSPVLTSTAVVTALHKAPGDALLPGQMLAEVSGRPIIAWGLPFPAYRDVAPGDDGPDVLAIQQALSDLGLYHGRLDSTYGPGTAGAVERLYKNAGVTPPRVSEEAMAAVRSAEDALAEAQLAESPEPTVLATARESLASAREAALVPLPQTEVLAVSAAGVTVVAVAPVGTVIGEEDSGLAVATVRSGTPSVVARVSVDQIDDFAVGTEVTVTGIVGAGPPSIATVTAVADFSSSTADSDQLPGRDITLSLSPGASFGDQAEVLLTSAAPAPAEGLSVPLVAIREDPEGTFVLRLPGSSRSESSAERVSVTMTVAGDGYALVGPGELEAGDVVVVSQPS